MTDDQKPELPKLVLPAKVMRVVDGDTVEVVIPIRAMVRLLDCWAPKLSTPEGIASDLHLRELTQGEQAKLTVPIREGGGLADLFSFGRILGRLEVAGQDVSRAQVEAGHATREKP